MKTKERTTSLKTIVKVGRFFKFNLPTLLVTAFMLFAALPASAHCDSYDGPVIKDALMALEQNKVELVLKWVEPKYEKEITDKFKQTLKLKGKNKEINEILETSFLETLVRLHREGEGASYTGLKPVGSMTKLVEMADNSLAKKEVNEVINIVTSHLKEVLQEKYTKAIELSKTKDNSVEEGRAYVVAYVEYTHTLEALEHILHGEISHSEGNGHNH